MTKRKNPEDKLPVGRKSGYDPKVHPAMLEDIMGKGGSFVRFCAKANICRDTGYEWIKQFPEFSDTFTRVKEQCEAIWEQRFEEGIYDPKVNAPLFKFYMANRFKWTEKQETAVTGKVEGFALNIDLGEKK